MLKINFAYLCGCPYRCPWCQNADVALANPEVCREMEISEIIKNLKENFIIDAVTITGGEPLMQNETFELCLRIKNETNLLLKIDHNGFYPETLQKFLPLLDFIGLDIKAPFTEKYGSAVGRDDWKNVVERVRRTCEILAEWDGKKEARTTVVPTLTDESEIIEIAKIANKYKFSIYTLNEFRAERTLDEKFQNIAPYSYEKMLNLGKIAKEYLDKAEVYVVTSKKGRYS
ncbi:MAG: anaerobic ribonucleoside-triphosphate reductase activating protein [Candidatus Altiarchaeales archaeon HGW-Altiarchaeales-2]|nr:MAG: anaerobic ribonucleoside-triphosphate reductase activating protein [Candidatus Altiarchaeales archaeon HGW-Altiarchaeales-2]